MKKFAIALLSAGLLISSGLQAQENAGGAASSSSAFGDLDKNTIIVAAVATGIIVAAIANSNGNVKGSPTQEPECDGNDPLVDGICTGTTTTVTVSGTTTINVPVTFTYFPTIRS
ncbi:hypothetical protein [Paraglaciecola sp.]|uniref:hypothetical protein n=1 Tax=Paraglaciecola sp. TaxID=1920173 RepID=UPI0030F40ED0